MKLTSALRVIKKTAYQLALLIQSTDVNTAQGQDFVHCESNQRAWEKNNTSSVHK